MNGWPVGGEAKPFVSVPMEILNLHNKRGINDWGIHLLVERQHGRTDAGRFIRIKNGLVAILPNRMIGLGGMRTMI